MRNNIKKLFAFVTAFVLVTALPFSTSAANVEDFSDVRPGGWYYSAVKYAVSKGLFSGTSASTFAPDAPMTRGMFVRVLANKAGIDTSQYAGSSFSDVEAGIWYAGPVEWAAENNIVAGIGGGKFAPNRNVTREQMAVILYNYARYTGCDLMSRAGALVRFSDYGKISSYAWHPMEWAVTHGFLAGSGGKLNPQGTATRAQVAQVFKNAHNLLSGSGEPDQPTPTPTATPAPGAPRINISDEVRMKLKPNQDPEKLLDYVLHGKNDDPTFSYDGTTAKWDPTLPAETSGVSQYIWGNWDEEESELRSSSTIGNCFQMMLTRTASDRFYSGADDSISSFLMDYHPADVPDSRAMKEVKAALNLPSSKKFTRSLCYEGAGWAGPLPLELYGGAKGIAAKIEYYLCDMHPYTTEYYLTEPSPGIFYLLYGAGNS